MQDLRTLFAIAKEERELKIYNEFKELSARPGAMKTMVTKVVCEKYGIHSTVTLLQMRKRVEKRLAVQDAVPS